MNKKLYKLMNWAAIEEIIYSECDSPQNLLGPHAGGGGTLVQAYFPGAKKVRVKWLSGDPVVGITETEMEIADDDGYFAVILPEKKVINYTYLVSYDDRTIEMGDPYRHEQIMTKKDINDFSNGNLMDAYKKIGAIPMSHAGEKGVYFCVYAPNAMRISVVGEFNSFDGRVNQMKRIDGGFFELFIPGDLVGMKYQYEIKLKGDIILKRNDPFSKVICDGLSVVSATDNFKWTDAEAVKFNDKKPSKMVVYELLNEIFNVETSKFKKTAEKVINFVKSQGYNYIQLGPMQNQNSGTLNTSFIYSINGNGNESINIKKFVDLCHSKNIGVIFNWCPSGFGREQFGLERFDGTALYEHNDPKQGINADGSKMLYQYGKPEVISFLISNGLYLIKEYHADGICLNNVSQMIYLDYGKTEGAWIPNQFGTNENIEAIEFIKQFISAANKLRKGIVIFAEDSSTHSGMTINADKEGLGFDYKWNEGFSSSYFDYMSYDPIERSSHHNELVDELVYSFAEKFILPLSGQLLSSENGYLNLYPGNEEMKLNSNRLTLAYTFMHPGYKLISEGFDNENKRLVSDLIKLYDNEPAIGEQNENSESFEWLSNMNADGCYISFIRKTDDPEEMLIAFANFAGIEQSIRFGVPYEGKYQELLNTDDSTYGGNGIVNKDILAATDIVADGKSTSIEFKLAPLSMSIMKFIPYTETELVKVIEERIRRSTPIKKTKKGSK